MVFIQCNATNIVNNHSINTISFYKTADYNDYISGYYPNGNAYKILVPKNAKYVIIGSNTTANGEYIELNSPIMEIHDKIYEPFRASLMLPDHYSLVVNDTFELFYKGIISSYIEDNFVVVCECSIGSTYTKKFVARPTTAGNYDLKIYLYDKNGILQDCKTTTLIVSQTPTSPGKQINVLCVGDSLTVHGEWVKEFARRLQGSGGNPSGNNLTNINFIGSREIDSIRYEGYGGYSFDSYTKANVSNRVKLITCTHDKTEALDQHSVYKDAGNHEWKLETIDNNSIKITTDSGDGSTLQTNGTLTWVSGGVNHSNIVYTNAVNASGNPFWNTSTNTVDFVSYANRFNVNTIDYMIILLGWNSANSLASTLVGNIYVFLNLIKQQFPNIKIIASGLQIPARDGMGSNYGTNMVYSNYIKLKDYVFNLEKYYNKAIERGSFTDITVVNLSGQFDSDNNMPENNRVVNVRNTKTEIYQTNGVHPANSGYMQIADAVYREFVHLLMSQ